MVRRLHPTAAVLLVTAMVVVESGLSEALCSDCPTYWTAFGDSCYRFFGQRVTLKQAQDNCRIHGSAGRFAYLVSIHSQEENDFLAALFKSYTEVSENPHQHVWVGLKYKEEEDTFVWSDGTDVNFANWGIGEPNFDGATSQHGVVLIHPNHGQRDTWHDTPVTSNYRYFCKMSMNDQ